MESPDNQSILDSQSTHHENSERARQHSERMSVLHEGAIIVTICMAQILALSVLGQGLAPLHIFGGNFGITNEGQISWYLAAFSLTVGTFILPAGRLGDNLFWYGVWSLIAGFSVYSTSILFSVCRSFQGIGPALIVPNALAIAGCSFQGKKKNYVFACFGASAPAGAVLGGVFAAIFSQLIWWPWTYWVMGIVLFTYTATSCLILPPDEQDVRSAVSKPTFDFAGTITGVTGLVISNFAWNQAAVVEWSVPYTYILLIFGMLFFGIFIYVETHVARYPLVPIKSPSKEALYALSIIACGWACFGICVFYLWQLIENLRHHSVLSAAAQQCPVGMSGLLASLAVGYLFSKFHVAYIMVGAMACFITGQVLLATVPVSQTYWAQTFVALIVMPWGMDMSFPAGTIILSNGMPREHQGIAASLINTSIAGTTIWQTDTRDDNTLGSYRNAWSFTIGLDGLGVVVALYFLWISAGRSKARC
ncbi:YOR378W-like protein [Rhexocercosporidium sp. MPI-PUGE-AT-0058]|nr:YOR378W-like protein [Rhexocercosporidium sp. MPI-PUGE-AT-0058]